jgi:hypothetical protein
MMIGLLGMALAAEHIKRLVILSAEIGMPIVIEGKYPGLVHVCCARW